MVGQFVKTFGKNPRNTIIEFFLEGRELDYGVGDLIENLNLNRATAYNTVELLEKEKILTKTRKLVGKQLYGLNKKSKRVEKLIKSFNVILKGIVKEDIGDWGRSKKCKK